MEGIQIFIQIALFDECLEFMFPYWNSKIGLNTKNSSGNFNKKHCCFLRSVCGWHLKAMNQWGLRHQSWMSDSDLIISMEKGRIKETISIGDAYQALMTPLLQQLVQNIPWWQVLEIPVCQTHPVTAPWTPCSKCYYSIHGRVSMSLL